MSKEVMQQALMTAAQRVLDEFGTASEGLQELYQALKPYAAAPQPAQSSPIPHMQVRRGSDGAVRDIHATKDGRCDVNALNDFLTETGLQESATTVGFQGSSRTLAAKAQPDIRPPDLYYEAGKAVSEHPLARRQPAQPEPWYRPSAELAAIYGEMCAINETPRKEQTEVQTARLNVLRAECVAIHEKRLATPPQPAQPAQPEQEPVAAIHLGGDLLDDGRVVATYALPVTERNAPKLYTFPPQRQPLTKDDIRAAGGIVHSDGNVFFTSVEQLHQAVGMGTKP